MFFKTSLNSYILANFDRGIFLKRSISIFKKIWVEKWALLSSIGGIRQSRKGVSLRELHFRSIKIFISIWLFESFFKLITWKITYQFFFFAFILIFVPLFICLIALVNEKETCQLILSVHTVKIAWLVVRHFACFTQPTKLRKQHAPFCTFPPLPLEVFCGFDHFYTFSACITSDCLRESECFVNVWVCQFTTPTEWVIDQWCLALLLFKIQVFKPSC